ncbi:MAG: hypothetical protein HC805_04085 [Alkalinema sp. RL_2_19]|nr:hypothetical protein [Alkalinema sp. RL_2_19]
MRILGLSLAIGVTAVGLWPSVVWSQAVSQPNAPMVGGASTFLPPFDPTASAATSRFSTLPAMSEAIAII